VVHGMADDRVNVLINGMSLAPACANHMNPPMSYIGPANVGSVSVRAGITPVSRAAIASAEPSRWTRRPRYCPTQPGSSDPWRRFGISPHQWVVNGGNAWLSAATGSFRVSYVGSYVNANDYKDGAGVMIKSTFYESENHALEFAVRHGNNLISVDLGYQHIPQQGFVNARMDMTDNQAASANVHYEGVFARVKLQARVFYEDTRHVMNILRDKIPGMNMPMDTKGANVGYLVEADIPLSPRDTLRVGNELRHFGLNDWWTPVSPWLAPWGPIRF